MSAAAEAAAAAEEEELFGGPAGLRLAGALEALAVAAPRMLLAVSRTRVEDGLVVSEPKESEVDPSYRHVAEEIFKALAAWECVVAGAGCDMQHELTAGHEHARRVAAPTASAA